MSSCWLLRLRSCCQRRMACEDGECTEDVTMIECSEPLALLMTGRLVEERGQKYECLIGSQSKGRQVD